MTVPNVAVKCLSIDEEKVGIGNVNQNSALILCLLYVGGSEQPRIQATDVRDELRLISVH